MLNSSYRLLKFKASLVSFTVLFLVAAYVFVGRAAFFLLPDYQKTLEQSLSEQLQVPVKVERLSGRWLGFDPIIDIEGLSINGSENAYVGRTRIHISFLASIYALAPRFKSIVVEHSEFALFQDVQGLWKAAGFEMSENTSSEDADYSKLNSFFNGAAITLLDNAISLRNKHGKIQTLRLPVISLNYRGDKLFASGKVLQEKGSKTLLNFSLEGKGVLAKQEVSGTLYLEARSSEFFDRILNRYQWEHVSIQNIDASARVWLSFKGFNVNSIQGDVQVHQINWKAAEKSLAPIVNAALDFEWTKTVEQSQLSLKGLGLSWVGEVCHSADIDILSQAQETQINANYLDVQCISRIAAATGILPTDLQARLEKSLPTGLLKNVQLTIRQSDGNDTTADAIVSDTTETDAKGIDAKGIDAKGSGTEHQAFNFEAELDNVSLAAYSGAPMLKGVDGYIQADMNGGDVYFDSERFELGFPSLFSQSWLMKRTEGAVSWLINEDSIEVYSEGLRLTQLDDSLVYGDFFLRLNPPEEEDYLGLSLGMQDVNFKNASDFVPVHIVGEDLTSWLDKSLVSGVVSEGIYVGYGSIEVDSPEHSFTSSLFLKTRQGELSFAEGWPNLQGLDAKVNLQNGELEINAQRAQIKDTELSDVYVFMPETQEDDAGRLNVKASLKAGEPELDYWLTESPISMHTQGIAEQLKIEGEIDIVLDLDIPLSEEEEVAYVIENKLESVAVTHIDSDLTFTDVEGVLLVSSASGVSAENIQTQFLGQLAIVNIETQNNQTLIQLDAGVRIERLLKYFGEAEITGLSGGLNYHAQLSLPAEEVAYPKLKLSSDLEGVSYAWPEPLYKDYLETRQLELSLLIKPDQMYLNVHLESDDSPRIDSELLFVSNKFTFGEVLIGGAQSHNPDITGLNIVANIDELTLEPWLDFMQKIAGEQSADTEENMLKRIELKLENLSAYGQNFKQTQAIFTHNENYWQLDLSGDAIQGQIHMPSEKTILDIQLEHIFLASEDLKGELESSFDQEDFDPRLLPEMTFVSKKLIHNKNNYGTWKTHVIPSDQGTVFSGLKGKIKGTTFDGQLNWKYDNTNPDKVSHTSILTLDVQGDKFEELSEAIGRAPLISSEKYNASVALVWPDEPRNFDLAKVSGSTSMEMESGFLNTEDAKTGVLRVFGILNAESIVRRLKLDFSDLYKSGVSYDVFSVKAKINQGLLTLSDPLLIEGPSSSYVINGSVDLSNETLDLDMLVELPFAQNIPLAALILGAPQIGGVVWVIDKILGEPLSSITTARYDISGSWDEPKMDLHQVMNASKKDRSKERPTR